MPATEVRRFRISVPVTDEVVLAWIENQANVSSSLRAIVKESVRRHGLADVFSSRLPTDGDYEVAPAPVKVSTGKKRGRPRKSESASTPVVEVARPVARARPVREDAPSGPGIQMSADSMAEFAFGDFGLSDIEISPDDGETEDIAAMMSKS